MTAKTVAERDLAHFQASLMPTTLVSASTTVSGTLKVDEEMGAVSYRAGRDHAPDVRKAGDLAYLSRPHRENRVFRIDRIEHVSGNLYDVVGSLPFKH